MWNLMDAEIRTACAYFIAVIVVGCYFFWNVWLNAMLSVYMRLNKEDAVSPRTTRRWATSGTGCVHASSVTGTTSLAGNHGC